jgi:RNA polymerase sigma-70 factor, ECF subfamily
MTNPEAPADRELMAALGDGDRDALRTLYDRHSPWLLARLARRCNDRGMVDEVLQETFVQAWRKASSYDGRGEVAAWLWGIGIRRLIDHVRRTRPVQLRATIDRGEEGSVEEQVLAGVEFGDLGGALARLSPELRAVVQATVLDGLTTREASELLGIPTGTVKTRMMRARMRLREELA